MYELDTNTMYTFQIGQPSVCVLVAVHLQVLKTFEMLYIAAFIITVLVIIISNVS